MRPPDGLIMQLRNTARMLMMALYYAQKCEQDPKIDYAEERNGARIHKVKQGITAWPVDVNQMLGFKRIALPDDMASIDGKDSPVIPGLKPICNILRRQSVYNTRISRDGDAVRDYADYDEADLSALKEALNLSISSVWQGPVDHACYRPWHLMLNGPPLRIAAEMLLEFTHMLVSNHDITGKRPVFGLHEYNPIAVCENCNGLFIRTRADGKYCSVPCRSAAFNQRMGKEYFAEKQRDSREAKRKQKEARKRGR
jgi:hypothetical protein